MSNIIWKYVVRELDDKEVEKMEKNFGVEFPNLYKKNIKKYNGGSPDKVRVDVPNNTRVFGGLLKYDESSLNIWSTYERAKECMLDGIIPFGEDPFGNLFCFDYRKNAENPQVVLWLRELAVCEDDYDEDDLKTFDIKEVQEKAMQFIANDFEDLLNRLY